MEAQNLFHDLKENIGIDGLLDVRVLNIYDVFNLGENDLEKLEKTVFSEINVDNVFRSFDEVFEKKIQKTCISQWNFCQGNMIRERILQFNV